MPLDAAIADLFAPPVRDGRADPSGQRSHRGTTNYHAGVCAEDAVIRLLQRRGIEILAQRWRGPWGEIDIIAQNKDRLLFIEVKRARTHGQAKQRLTRRQAQRIMSSAQVYVGKLPHGSATPCRFDLATVDGIGDVQILENAFLDFCM